MFYLHVLDLRRSTHLDATRSDGFLRPVLFRRPPRLHKLLPRREALGRPIARVPGLALRVAIHDVDVLEREVRRLVQEQVHDDRAREVACREDETVAVLDGLHDERREEREQEVPQPVRRRRERGLARTRARWERLADEDPDTATDILALGITGRCR